MPRTNKLLASEEFAFVSLEKQDFCTVVPSKLEVPSGLLDCNNLSTLNTNRLVICDKCGDSDSDVAFIESDFKNGFCQGHGSRFICSVCWNNNGLEIYHVSWKTILKGRHSNQQYQSITSSFKKKGAIPCPITNCRKARFCYTLKPKFILENTVRQSRTPRVHLRDTRVKPYNTRNQTKKMLKDVQTI